MPAVSPGRSRSVEIAQRRVTQMFFAGEPLNDQDVVLQSVIRRRGSLIGLLQPTPEDENSETRPIAFDIVLRRG